MLHDPTSRRPGPLDHTDQRQAVHPSDVVRALWRSRLARAERPEPPSNAARKIAIERHVEERIGAADLDVTSVVKRFGLSRPTLQRLFEQEGGFASYVRERRLRRAFARLARRDLPRQRVSDVAYAHGFADPSTFSRAFQHRFGVAPRDVAAGVPRRSSRE